MKKILFLVLILGLAGCDDRPLDQREYTQTTMSNIPELADCVYIRIGDIRIFRCPNSSTTTVHEVPHGKTRKTITTTVITGPEK